MKTKKEIVENWLPRYTGVKLKDFGKYILLTNFDNYVDIFAELNGVKVDGKDKAMPSATANKITIINSCFVVFNFFKNRLVSRRA